MRLNYDLMTINSPYLYATWVTQNVPYQIRDMKKKRSATENSFVYAVKAGINPEIWENMELCNFPNY